MSFTKEQIEGIQSGITDPKKTKATSSIGFTAEQIEAVQNSGRAIGGGGLSQIGIDPDDYDFNLKAGDFDNNLYRAQDQSWGTQLLNGVAKGVAKIPLQVIGNAASILDIEDYWNQDDEIGNDITRAMNTQQEKLDEMFPIYAERPGETLAIGDFAWWAENGSGLLSSAGAFAITGFGTGALLSKGTSALKWIALATKGRKAVKAINSVERFATTFGNALALNQAEGMLTAIDTYDETYKRAVQQGKSQDEAKVMAASAGAHSINVNRMNITLNMTSSAAFMKGVNKGLTRNILKKEAIGKTILSEGLQEYAEEVVNLYAEQEGKRIADYQIRGKNSDYTSDKMGSLVDTFFSLKGLEAGLLGAVGGMAQTGFTHLGNNVKIGGKSKTGELNARIAAQQKNIKEMDAIFKKAGISNYETALSYLDKTNDIVKERDGLLEQVEALNADNKDIPSSLANRIELLSEQIVSFQGLASYKQGTTEHLINQYKELEGLSVEEAKARGYSGDQLNENSPAYYQKRAKAAREIVESGEKIYQEHYSYKDLESIYVNRIAAKNLKGAISQLDTDLNSALASVSSTYENLPRFSTQEKVPIAQFEELHPIGKDDDSKQRRKELKKERENLTTEEKKELANKKRYITNARKISSVEAAEEAYERLRNSKEELIKTQERYEQLTSFDHQREQARIEREEVTKEKKKIADKEVKAKKEADLASAQDDVDTQKAGVLETTSAEGVEEGVDQANLDTEITDTIGPDTVVEDDEGQAILEQIAAQEQGKADAALLEANAQEAKDQEEKDTVENEEAVKTIADNLEFAEAKDYQGEDNVNASKVEKSITDKEKTVQESIPPTLTIAYKATVDGEATGELVADLNKDILDFDKINVGTEITIKVDDSYDGDVFYEGEMQNWPILKADLESKGLTAEIEMNTPIVIMVKGEKIGFIHATNWVTKETLKHTPGADVKEEKQKLNALRKAVLKKGSVKTKITATTNGYFAKSKETKPLKEAMPGIEIAVIENNSIRTVAKEKGIIVTNLDTIGKLSGENSRNKNGFTVAFVPVKKVDGEVHYTAVPLLRQKLTQEAKTSVVKAVKVFMDTKNPDEISSKDKTLNKKIRKEIIEATLDLNEGEGLDITTVQGLAQYMQLFTFTDRSLEGNLRSFMLNKHPKYTAINIGSIGVAFGKGGKPAKGQSAVVDPSIYTNDSKAYLDLLESFLGDMYAHISVEHMGTEINIPIITADGKVDSNYFNGSYDEYLHTKALQTPLRGHNIGTEENPKYAYTLQRKISFDTSFAEGVEIVDQKPAVQATENIDSKEEVIEDTTSINKEKETLDIEGKKLKAQQATLLSNPELQVEVIFEKFDLTDPGVFQAIKEAGWDITDNIDKIDFNVVRKNLKEAKQLKALERVELAIKNINKVRKETKNKYQAIEKKLKTLSDEYRALDTEANKKVKKAPSSDSEKVKIVKNFLEEKNKGIDFEGLDSTSNKSEDSDIQELIATVSSAITSDYSISTLTGKEQSLILDYIVQNILELADMQDGYVEAVYIRETISNIIEKMPNKLSEQGWKLNNLVRLKLQQVTDTVIDPDLLVDNDETKSLTDKEKIWNQDILTVNPKSSLSSRLKRVLNYTQRLSPEGVPLASKLGFPIYIGPDDTYGTIINVLSETYTGEVRQEVSFSAMMKTLENYADIHPFLIDAVKKLKAADRKTQFEFVVVANKHYVQMNFVMEGTSNTEGYYLNVNEDNANSRLQSVKAFWRENNLWVADISDELHPNLKVVQELKDTFESWKKDQIYPVKEVKAWLARMGMTVNETTLESFKDEDSLVSNLEYEAHFTSSGGIFYELNESLDRLEAEDELLESDLTTHTVVGRLASQEARHNAMFIANSFRSGDKSIYAHADNKFAASRTADLLYDVELLTSLAKNPATRNSSWLRKLVKLDKKKQIILDPKTDQVIINKEGVFHKEFNFGYLGLTALKEYNSFTRGDKKMSNLSNAEHEKVKMGFFESKGVTTKKNRIVRFFFPTMSDKSAVFSSKALAETIKLDDKGKATTATINTLYDTIVKPELERIANFKAGEVNVLDYDAGAQLFYNIPELNNIPDLWDVSDTDPTVKDLKTSALIKGGEANKLIIKALAEHVDKVIDKQLEDWTKFGIYDAEADLLNIDNKYLSRYVANNVSDADIEGETTAEKEENRTKAYARFAAADYALNYMIANSNYNLLYVSDLAQYFKAPKFKADDTEVDSEGKPLFVDPETGEAFKKGKKIPVGHPSYALAAVKETYINVGKRLGGLQGSGYNGEYDRPTYRQGFISEPIRDSTKREYYENLYGKDSFEASKYKDIDGADAQEWISVPEKLAILRSNGKISDKTYKNLKDKFNNKEDFTPTDLIEMQVFQPDKPIYVGAVYEKGSSFERKVYIKSSAMTLVPQFTRGLEIDKLRAAMENQNISRVTVPTGVKTGNVVAPLEIWEVVNKKQTGRIKEDLFFEPSQILDLNRADLRIQQDEPYKNKESISRVAQASKLAFVNILDIEGFKFEGKEFTGKELQEEYLKNWDTLYKRSMYKVLNRFGINPEDDQWVPNPEKLKEVLKEEAEKRNYSLQDIEGLTMLPDGSFELPLWASGASAQFESLLSSLITNDVIKQKMPGKAYVLGSEEGFMSQEKAMDIFGNLSNAGIVFTEEFTGQLNPAEPSNGEPNNQVLIPWPFKGLDIQDFMVNGKLDLSLIAPELMEMYGMRIPNQGPNSTGNVKVVGFLPEAMGDIIIAPRDFVTQMGSDFDIDKLYTYALNYLVDAEGKLARVTEETYSRERLEAQVIELESIILQLEELSNDVSRIPKIRKFKSRLKNLENLLTEDGLERAVAQDNITLIHRAINSSANPIVEKQVSAPLDFGGLEAAADRIDDARDDPNELFSPLSSSYQRTKFKNGASGNTAISVFAVYNTFNALAQVSKKNKKDGLFLYHDKNHVVPFKVRFGTQYNKDGSLSSIKTLDGSQDISYNVSAYVSASVDNEKAQILHKLNINDKTFATVTLLTQLGFTSDVVSSFMAQDILIDYIELIETHQSKGLSVSQAKEAAKDDLLLDPKYALPDIEVSEDAEFEAQTEERATKLEEYKDLGSEQMYELIERGENTTDYKLKQIALLQKFENLQKAAGELRTVANVANIDSAGPGANLLESLAVEESVSNVFFNSKVKNTMNLFGAVVKAGKNTKSYAKDPEFTRVGDLYLKPKTIAGFATFYGVVANNKIWNQDKYFPYASDPVQMAMDAIKKIAVKDDFSVFKEEAINKQIFNGIKSYNFSDLTRLGLTQKGIVSDSATAARLVLLAGDNNLQKIIAENAHSKFFNKHAFLNKLSIKKRWNGVPGSIKFDHRTEDNDAKTNITNDLIALLNSNKPLPDNVKLSNRELQIETESDLASALIISQFASGGIQKYTQFLRFIPLDFLKKNGFTKAIRDTNFSTLLNEGKSNPKDPLSHFVVQFFQHNPKLLYQAETGAMLDIVEDATGAAKEFRIAMPVDAQGNPAPWKINPMVSIKKDKKFLVYVHNGDTYTRLDNLGGVDFNEYQKGMTARSVIFENQAREVEYYQQEISRTPANPVETKAKNLSREKLNVRYGLSGDTITIENTLEKVARNALSEGQRALAEDYLKVIKESGTDYSLVIDNSIASKGTHSNNKKQITINTSLLGEAKYGGEADYARTILHEITHLFTVEVLTNPKTTAQKAAKRSLEKLFDSYKKKVGSTQINNLKKEIKAAKKEGRPLNIPDKMTQEIIGRYYAGTDIFEFVASFMTDEITRSYLDTVDFGEGKTYGSEIERRLLKILHSRGIKDNTATSQGIREVIRLIQPRKNKEKLNTLVSRSGVVTSRLLDLIDRPTYSKGTQVYDVKETYNLDVKEGLKNAKSLDPAEGDTYEMPEGGLEEAFVLPDDPQQLPATASTFDLEDKIAEIIDNNQFIKLTADGNNYVNTKTKQEYKRVTQYISDDVVPDNALLRSSQTIGTKVDELVRDFFAGQLKPLNEYDVSSDRQLASFMKQLEALKARFDANGETVLANDIVLYNDEIGVAGTVDLLTYDKEGNFKIYDMKTMKGNNFTQSYMGETTSKYLSSKFGDSKKVKHQKQLSMYRILLNNTHGVKATAIEVLPIELNYEPGDVKTKKLKLLKNPIELSTLQEIKGAKLDESTTRISAFQKEILEEASEPVEVTEKKELAPSLEVRNPIIDTKKLIISDLNKKIARQTQRMYKTSNPAVRAVRQTTIDAAKEEIINLTSEIEELKNVQVYQELYDTGELDLHYVDILLGQDRRLLNDEDLLIMERLLTLWETFPDSNFATASDENREHRDKFITLKNRAEDLNDVFYNLKVQKTQDFIRTQLGKGATDSQIEKVLDAMDDVGLGTEFTLDIGRVDSVLLQAVSTAIQVATNRTSEELAIMAEELDPLVKNMRKALKDTGLTEEIFLQEDEQGRKSGRMVSIYAQKYHETKTTKKTNAFSEEATAEDRQAYKEWQKNNEFIIDPSKLEDSKYTDKIAANVGIDNVTNIKKRALELQSYYETAKETKIASLQQDSNLNKEEKKKALALWEIQYNPSTYSTYREGTAVEGGMRWAKESYVLTIPLKINKLGNETGYYDSQYATIQQNDSLREFHEYVESTLRKLRELLPDNKEAVNSIALMQKTFMEAYMGSNGQAKLNLFADSVKLTSRGGGIDQSYIGDQLTEGRMLSSNFAKGLEKEKRDMLKLKEIQYTQEHGEAPDLKLSREWAKDIADELVSKSSVSLSEALKTYASIAIAYKHKSQIETPLRIAEQVLDTVKENKKGASGSILKDNENTPVSEEGLKRMKDMVSSTLNHFFGNPKKTEGQFGKTQYTSEEKKTLKEVEEALEVSDKVLKQLDDDLDSGKITKETYRTEREDEDKNNQFLEQKKDSLGGKKSATGVINVFQKYMQTLGMGWNAMAGIANMGFGTIANLVEASGGQFFSTGEYIKAFMKVAKQIGGLKTEEAKKISVLMRRWGTLQKSSQEIFKTKTAKNKILGMLNPYKIQDTTEYMNQAPILVLMQEKTKLLDAEGNPVIFEGEEINWYTAYDNKGDWRTELGSEDDYQNQKDKLKIKVNTLIRTIHGNYDMEGAHTKVKDTVVGRMLSQFRSWMFEGFATRFEKEYKDSILNVTRKGRYITLFEQNLKLLSPGNIKNLSEIDKINAKKLLSEAIMYTALTTMIVMLKGLAEDEEDEDKLAVMHTIINLSLRLQTDILFYINPSDFEHLTKAAVPMASIVSNFTNFASSAYTFIFNNEDDKIAGGVYYGQSRFKRASFKILPGLSAIQKVKSAQEQIFEK